MQVRGLAHRAHWSGLPTGQFFERFGAVPASPRAAYKLLKQGDSVLLFPGGGREVRAHVTQLLACWLRWQHAGRLQAVQPSCKWSCFCR